MDNLLAPCNKCIDITDTEIGYILGPSVTLFKTFNGSSRYVYQVHGRSVAVLHVKSRSRQSGRVVYVFAHPDYSNAGLFRELYRFARKDFGQLKLGPELETCQQALELVHDIKGLK